MDTSSAQVAALSREVATLTASLHRERQRRAAIAQHAREAEQRAAVAVQTQRRLEYANRKLEQDIAQMKSDGEKDTTSTNNNSNNISRQELEAQVAALKAQLKEATVTTAATAPPPTDDTFEELHNVLPQYRASISSLQGKIALVTKQLEQTAAQRVAAEQEAAKWKSTAQRLEVVHAEATARLHTQELTNAKLTETIRNLESVVQEQKEDVLAALDLVYQQSSSAGGTPRNGLSYNNNGLFNKTNEKVLEDIDMRLEYLEKLASPSVPPLLGPPPPPSNHDNDVGNVEEEEGEWKIGTSLSASATTTEGGVAAGVEDTKKQMVIDVATKETTMVSLSPSPRSKNKADARFMKDALKEEIAALKQALQSVVL